MIKDKIEHKFSKEEKIEWWGEGEWADEPDLVVFQYKNFHCMILRIAAEEPFSKDFHMFGGFLNGYVSIPINHPYFQMKHDDMNVHCHGGITFSEAKPDHWIGFDCAHSFDYLPSTEYLKKKFGCMQKYQNDIHQLMINFNLEDSPIFKIEYRNIDFCIEQCKSIVDQLIEIAEG